MSDFDNWFDEQEVPPFEDAPTSQVAPAPIDAPTPAPDEPEEEAAGASQPALVNKPNGLFDHQEEMWDTIDAFENRAWSARNVGIPTGWADFDRAFEGGLKTGWILIGGDSNIGKTSFLSTLAWNISQSSQDVYVMDFSLDDPMHDKIPRVVAAANKVIINAVGTPNNYTQYPDMLKRREDGMMKLRNAIDRYRCYDANFSTDIDAIEDEIRRQLTNLETEANTVGGERRRLVVLIDNFHDLSTTASAAQGGDKQKFDYLAQRVSDMATKYDIPIITTGEFKKLNGFRRPGLDDLRESVKIKYEAKAVILCYNEVGLKGEAASIYYERNGRPERQPVFEASFAKNKMGGFKGRLFFEFYPEIAHFEPADKASAQRYSNVIYSNN